MSSSVILSAVCLILLQNLVYTLPATDPQHQVEQSSQGTSNSGQKVTTTTVSNEPSQTSTAPTSAVKKTTIEGNTEKTESETTKPEVKDPMMSTEGPAAPSKQAQEEHKGGSASAVYANFGMLLVTASVLLRL